MCCTSACAWKLEPQIASLLELGCVAGQGFLFSKARSLAELSNSGCVARRDELWTGAAASAAESLSATGRFAALGTHRNKLNRAG